MPRSTTMRHLRSLRDEGKLENAGGQTQPIYIPKNRYYTGK
ncbi:hypothetical protein NXY00_18590 [Bacteroides sp. BFG-551]|nr:hypothetical protein [Bacteroides sp. BFG-551]